MFEKVEESRKITGNTKRKKFPQSSIRKITLKDLPVRDEPVTVLRYDSRSSVIMLDTYYVKHHSYPGNLNFP